MNENGDRRKRLEGKSAVITGATGGIGEAIAKLFLREGASVMLVGRSAEKLVRTMGRLGDDARAATFVAEVHDEAAIAAAVAKTVEVFGGLDVLVANAGTEGTFSPLETLAVEEFESVLRTNVIGVFLSMKHCIVPMRERGGGSIIATSSIAGTIGSPLMAPYITSKHAVNGLVKTAALELGPSKIRVNAIGPGPIENRMIESLERQYLPENPRAFRDDLISKIALGRYGTNEEVAQMALFLASEESSYCTGSIQMLDGGFTVA